MSPPSTPSSSRTQPAFKFTLSPGQRSERTSLSSASVDSFHSSPAQLLSQQQPRSRSPSRATVPSAPFGSPTKGGYRPERGITKGRLWMANGGVGGSPSRALRESLNPAVYQGDSSISLPLSSALESDSDDNDTRSSPRSWPFFHKVARTSASSHSNVSEKLHHSAARLLSFASSHSRKASSSSPRSSSPLTPPWQIDSPMALDHPVKLSGGVRVVGKATGMGLGIGEEMDRNRDFSGAIVVRTPQDAFNVVNKYGNPTFVEDGVFSSTATNRFGNTTTGSYEPVSSAKQGRSLPSPPHRDPPSKSPGERAPAKNTQLRYDPNRRPELPLRAPPPLPFTPSRGLTEVVSVPKSVSPDNVDVFFPRRTPPALHSRMGSQASSQHPVERIVPSCSEPPKTPPPLMPAATPKSKRSFSGLRESLLAVKATEMCPLASSSTSTHSSPIEYLLPSLSSPPSPIDTSVAFRTEAEAGEDAEMEMAAFPAPSPSTSITAPSARKHSSRQGPFSATLLGVQTSFLPSPTSPASTSGSIATIQESNTLVKLNVGGTVFVTYLHTLLAPACDPHSRLARFAQACAEAGEVSGKGEEEQGDEEWKSGRRGTSRKVEKGLFPEDVGQEAQEDGDGEKDREPNRSPTSLLGVPRHKHRPRLYDTPTSTVSPIPTSSTSSSAYSVDSNREFTMSSAAKEEEGETESEFTADGWASATSSFVFHSINPFLHPLSPLRSPSADCNTRATSTMIAAKGERIRMPSRPTTNFEFISGPAADFGIRRPSLGDVLVVAPASTPDGDAEDEGISRHTVTATASVVSVGADKNTKFVTIPPEEEEDGPEAEAFLGPLMRAQREAARRLPKLSAGVRTAGHEYDEAERRAAALVSASGCTSSTSSTPSSPSALSSLLNELEISSQPPSRLAEPMVFPASPLPQRKCYCTTTGITASCRRDASKKATAFVSPHSPLSVDFDSSHEGNGLSSSTSLGGTTSCKSMQLPHGVQGSAEGSYGGCRSAHGDRMKATFLDIFLDRNPKPYSAILDYLRQGDGRLPDHLIPPSVLPLSPQDDGARLRQHHGSIAHGQRSQRSLTAGSTYSALGAAAPSEVPSALSEQHARRAEKALRKLELICDEAEWLGMDTLKANCEGAMRS